MKSGISVGIITHNEEKNIVRTLAAVIGWVNEIIIVDSHSTDNTVAIAESMGAKVYVEDWKGYGQQKNSAIDKCSSQWVLLIDADEEVSPALKTDLLSVINNPDAKQVYEINFTSICFGKPIKHGGWSNFYRIRFFTKDAGRYNDNKVHEKFISPHPAGRIKSVLYHYTSDTFEQFLQKQNRYSSEGAQEYYKRGKKASWGKLVLAPCIVFVKMYVLRLGFLDGYEGLALAKSSSAYAFWKYFKLRELYRQKQA